ncbi:Rpn family recombination-promoting nuclease/putative transposase [Dolichospermum circinale CS-534/05]|uniref:Rpn family recombination-promoting nuclease/putative transposase n=1 Tax=Dolichospermum circinale TaxID=109265 RepID=UPI00232B3357|nr:Rpn family recombination-promoting nuclease/putative transposase [Dolichospermum circinale]MDB9452955.1 Rpn family recombination-promoting nuclease/putative transposase [Dolichospermum circinale CS-541/06]MDB9461928.1 Rpn family recombination-promoting nuclease/putative transposase [Dolichospermum circinale CS-541/04]MDB9490453.1 Rpn family recombination-promoting nuclease/putative transposase [Dolichospermum circinale CS-534/05]MDB9546844.1 Rpn family recombination-promoting nuclease/putati
MSFDNVCKLLAEKYPFDFAKWLLPQAPKTIKVLKTELSIEPIRADFVTFLQTENRILHIEFQTNPQSKPPIPFRELDYSVRLIRTYQVPVTQVVIFLQETNDPIVFTEEYVNETTRHRYRVIRMWEQDSALFLDNLALLPLAPLTRTNSPQGLLSQIANNVAKIADRETKQDIAAYTEILAGLRFEKDFIRQLLSEDIMQESVIYQDILQKGERIGEQRGEVKFCLRLLNQRFGELDSLIVERVKGLPVEQLENLGAALFNISEVADLVTWLNQQDHQN